MANFGTMVSFAQENEDVILYYALDGDVRQADVFFIDVGANDPIALSVTMLFSMLGGRGINIEPLPEMKGRYELLRPRDINLFVGCSDKHGEMKLCGSGVMATMDAGNTPFYQGEGIMVPVYTLAEICDRYVPRYQPIHFLKVDVEGFERNVILGMDFSRYRPWILCIESCTPGTDHKDYDKWENLVLQSNYVFAYDGGINRYYVAGERIDIKRKFDVMKQLLGQSHILHLREG